MKKTISLTLLKRAGYKEYEDGLGNKTFQKKFVDKKGTKYYIHCSYSSLVGRIFWEFSMNLEIEQGAVEFTTIQWFNEGSGRTIKDVEDYFGWLWKIHKTPYYEFV